MKRCETKPQVAIVTGASRGIGRAVATALAKSRVDVVVNYKENECKAMEVVAECISFGAHAIAVQADVQIEADVERLFTMATQLGSPNILINNAGIDEYGLLSDLSLEKWNDIIGVNLTGAFLCCKRALPYLYLASRPRIINIASIHGISGAACESAYAASKGGLIALTKSLAKELASKQITVNAIAPGIIATDMMNRFEDAEVQEMKEDIPLGRLGLPGDIAGIVRFLISADASYLTGQVISPNGGQLT